MKISIKRFINQETISYLFFGVLTTFVNYVTFAIMLSIYDFKYPLLSNVVAFIFATAFAYITNKIWVFKSKIWDLKHLISEASQFTGTRILSFAFEQAGLIISIEILNVGYYSIFGINGIMMSKIILSFIAVLINYIVSKLFIFKKSE